MIVTHEKRLFLVSVDDRHEPRSFSIVFFVCLFLRFALLIMNVFFCSTSHTKDPVRCKTERNRSPTCSSASAPSLRAHRWGHDPLDWGRDPSVGERLPKENRPRVTLRISCSWLQQDAARTNPNDRGPTGHASYPLPYLPSPPPAPRRFGERRSVRKSSSPVGR